MSFNEEGRKRDQEWDSDNENSTEDWEDDEEDYIELQMEMEEEQMEFKYESLYQYVQSRGLPLLIHPKSYQWFKELITTE